MKNTLTVNTRLLEVWLAENGDFQARLKLCAENDISLSTFNKILKGHVPKFGIRHRLCKAIQISEEELFISSERQDAS